MILATHGIVGSQIGQVDSDYQAVLDYATTQGYTLPSASQKLLQEQLIKDLKSAGIWSKLDTFYVFATDGDSDFASINWKDPNNYEITEVNSPTFTTNVGFTGDGVSAYLNTNYSASTNGVNFTVNNASAMYYRENNANATTSATGGGGSHTHSGSFTGDAINMAVQYVDVIICTRN